MVSFNLYCIINVVCYIYNASFLASKDVSLMENNLKYI